MLRWAVAGLGTAGLPAGHGYSELSPVLLVGWFVALVALVVVLCRAAGRPELSAVPPAAEGKIGSG
ncbi:hypothetical protein [Nonomuraea sp. NPDC049684]|uniref:hypothetical protein n=1 Tax=Nonomuraea sp. NPDC049684 TaxID=3364356 RepID=UPI00378CF44A